MWDEEKGTMKCLARLGADGNTEFIFPRELGPFDWVKRHDRHQNNRLLGCYQGITCFWGAFHPANIVMISVR